MNKTLAILLLYRAFVLGGCAYLVGWCGWSAWWFLLVVFTMPMLHDGGNTK